MLKKNALLSGDIAANNHHLDTYGIFVTFLAAIWLRTCFGTIPHFTLQTTQSLSPNTERFWCNGF